MRSTATGLSEFELLMLERDADERPRRMSVEASAAAPSTGAVGTRPALVPRTAQRETHPLFVRSADSGISELEEYLKEISEMTPPARKCSAAASASAQGRSSVPAQPLTSPAPSSNGDSRATAPPRKLEPRTSQCERNALLEIKDESGLTELERLLMEKEEAAASSDGRGCTVCGAEARLSCECSRQTNRDGVAADRLRSASDTTGSDSASSAQQKRVRFMQQRQKTEPGGVTAAAAAQVERTISDSAAQPPTSNSNSVDTSAAAAAAAAAAKKSNKSRSSRGRGAGVRTDSSPAGVGAGGAAHRKSCCVS